MQGEITHQFKRQKRLLFLKRFLMTALGCFLATGAVFYVLTRITNLKSVKISGNERVSSVVLESKIREFLSQKYAPFWPKENLVFFSSKKMAEVLKSQFSAIETVNISRDIGGQSISVEIGERKPWAVRCAKDECFYVDDSGVLFERAPQFFGDLILKITDERPENPVVGGRVIVEETLKAVQEFIGEIKANNNLTIRNITIKPETELWLETGAGFKIVLDSKTDFNGAYENLNIFLKSEAGEKTGKINYVDLRFKDKTFFKEN